MPMSRVVELRAGPRYRAIELASSLPTQPGRSARQYETSLEREAVNIKTACMRLEFLLYANFDPSDWFVTLTYDDSHLPSSYEAARKNVPAFLRKVRESRRPRGQPCGYVYVMEGMHGDHRVHHHLVIHRADGDVLSLRSAWGKGNVDIRTIDAFGGIRKMAQYISKEPRKTGKLRVGQRMWTPSRGLIKPERTVTELQPGQHYIPPFGAEPLEGRRFPERIENSFGEYVLYDFEVQQKSNNTL